MIWIWIAAAAVAAVGAQPPRMLNADHLMTADDYPTAALQAGDYGVVSIHLQVTADGRVGGCAVTETSGSAPLDQATCSLALRRARFDPARDAAGQPIPGDYRTAMTFGIDEHQPLTIIPMRLGVKVLPAGYERPARVQAFFGADGKAIECVTRESSGNADADRAICDAIMREMIVKPPHSGSREPAVAVRTYRASLVPEPIAAAKPGG
jgi:TonB family protein